MVGEDTETVKTTEEIVAAKVEELTAKHNGAKINPLIFKDENGKDVIGYFVEPNRFTKLRAMDRVIKGEPVTAGAELLEACIIKDESDKRIYTDAPANDDYYLGAAMAVYRTLKWASNEFKKK